MNKVLLLSLPFKKGYQRNGRCDFVSWCGCQWYPVVLSQLGAYLEKHEQLVKVIDAQAWDWDEYKTGKEVQILKPSHVIIYAGDQSFESDLLYAKQLQSLGFKVCVAGHFYALKHNVALAEKEGITGIHGQLERGVMDWITGKVEEGSSHRGEDLRSADLDELLFVSEFMIRQLETKHYVAPSEPYPFIDIMTARGCVWGKCSYCVMPQKYAPKYAEMSIYRVLAELLWIRNHTSFRHVMIQDDIMHEKRLMELSIGLIKHRIKINWSTYTKANVSFHTLQTMKRAGCTHLHVGYESGNDDTLQTINKGITVEDARTFTAAAKKAGIKIHGDFMIGIDRYEKEIRRTIDFACDIRPDTVQFQKYIPYFGKKWHEDDRLTQLQKLAYWKFYGNPMNWTAIAKQILKPRIFTESVKSVFGGSHG